MCDQIFKNGLYLTIRIYQEFWFRVMNEVYYLNILYRFEITGHIL